MIICKTTQTQMRFLGYLPTYSQSKWYILYNYLIWLLTGILLGPTFRFFFANLSNVAVAVENMSMTTGAINGVIKGGVFIWHRKRVHRLMVELQSNVDSKEAAGRLKHYAEFNRLTNILTYINSGWETAAIISICFGPILKVLYHAIFVGDVQPEMYAPTVGLIYPFDTTTTPGYEITFVLAFVSITCIGYTMCFSDCIFMGICGQIVACKRDLRDMLTEVDATATKRDTIASAAEQRAIEKRLLRCVRFHYAISSYQKDIQTLSSPIVFAQFFISVIQLCALAFMVQNMSSIPIDRTISYLVTGVVALIELLIYCYFGDLASAEGVKIADAVYAVPWYKWPVPLRRYVGLMMIRAQQPTVFQGLKMVDCSLVTYSSVLKLVGSSLALLRSVVA